MGWASKAWATLAGATGLVLLLSGCNTEPAPDERGEQVGYRTGTADDDYLNNGERGNLNVTEVNWGGSIRNSGEYDPDDDFIELRNKHPRPIHLTGWIIEIEAGKNLDGRAQVSGEDRSRLQYIIPMREAANKAVQPNEFVVVARKRDGAFRNADYYIPEMRLPDGPWSITLRDLDERLLDGAGDSRKAPFAGGYDGFTVRSMERIQLVFSNRGNRDNAWHAYSLNDFDDGEQERVWHRDADTGLRVNVHVDYRARTFATPGRANSPDYSGNVSSGSLE